MFGSPPDHILKSSLFEVALVQFMVRGNNVSVDLFFFFFFDGHFCLPSNPLSINLFNGISPMVAQMQSMFFD